MTRPKLRAIHFAPLLALVALLGWALASPIGASPDDDYHLVSTWCSFTGDHCEETDVATTREVPNALLDAQCYAGLELESAECQSRIDFSPSTLKETDRGNFNQAYPPVYYAVMGLFAGDDIVASAMAMRIANVVIFVALTTALYTLLPARRQTLALMWLATTVPMGMFLISSNNPSGWAVVGVGTSWLALLGYLEVEGRRKWMLGVVFSLAAVMAAGARGDAAMYMLVAIGAVFLVTVPVGKRELTRERMRSYARDAILPAAVAVICVILFFTSRQTGAGLSGFGPPAGSAVPDEMGAAEQVKNGINLALSNLLNLPFLWAGNFGEWGLGWLDTKMPSLVSFASIAVVSVVVFWGLGTMWRRKLLVVALMGAVMVLLPLYVLQAGQNVVGQQVQPRYVLPIIVLFVGVALLERRNAASTITRTQLFVIAVGLVAAFTVALHTNLRRYLTGTDVRSFNLDANIEWWWSIPLTPNIVWIASSLCYALLVTVLLRDMRAGGLLSTRLSRQPREKIPA